MQEGHRSSLKCCGFLGPHPVSWPQWGTDSRGGICSHLPTLVECRMWNSGHKDRKSRANTDVSDRLHLMDQLAYRSILGISPSYDIIVTLMAFSTQYWRQPLGSPLGLTLCGKPWCIRMLRSKVRDIERALFEWGTCVLWTHPQDLRLS